MTGTIGERYRALLATGEIERDPGQEGAVVTLAALEARLARHRLAHKSSSLGWLFGRGSPDREPIRGLYLHGEVGRGKTMLMDLFFAATPVVRKRRVHFHEFMDEVHERVRVFREKLKQGEVSGEDPIRLTAAAIARESW